MCRRSWTPWPSWPPEPPDHMTLLTTSFLALGSYLQSYSSFQAFLHGRNHGQCKSIKIYHARKLHITNIDRVVTKLKQRLDQLATNRASCLYQQDYQLLDRLWLFNVSSQASIFWDTTRQQNPCNSAMKNDEWEDTEACF